MGTTKETKFGTKVALGMRMMPELRIYSILHATMKNALQHVMSVLEMAVRMSPAVVVTALCNQPEAFTLDLSDDQSRYLFNNVLKKSDFSALPLTGWFIFVFYVLKLTSLLSYAALSQ